MECKFNYLQGNANLNLKIVLAFLVNFRLFRHLTDATYDICYKFIDKTIDIWINLQVWNLTDATYDACDV